MRAAPHSCSQTRPARSVSNLFRLSIPSPICNARTSSCAHTRRGRGHTQQFCVPGLSARRGLGACVACVARRVTVQRVRQSTFITALDPGREDLDIPRR